MAADNATTITMEAQTTGESPPIAAFPPQVVVAEKHVEEGTKSCPKTEEEDAQLLVHQNGGDAKHMQQEEEENGVSVTEDASNKFEVGDHVYTWCSVIGIRGVFQHHGIVIHVEDIEEDYDGEEGESSSGDQQQLLTIADFSNLLLNNKRSRANNNNNSNSNTTTNSESSDAEDNTEHDELEELSQDGGRTEPQSTKEEETPETQPQSGSLTTGTLLRSASPTSVDFKSSRVRNYGGGLRVYKTWATNSKGKGSRWHKVQYQDHWFHTHLWKRSGTCTPIASDPPDVVLKRVQFLLAQSQLNEISDNNNNNNHHDSSSSILPKFHSIFANCECVAVWCKTGTWSTLQAASFLSHAAVGQAKATATVGGIAAASSVTVPASGVWGWLGYSTTVPLMSVNPFVLPAVITFGAVTIGGPAICLAVAKKRWKSTTEKLNKALEEDSFQASLVT